MDDERTLKVRIDRYQQGIFALALYLIGGDRDRAYDITVSSFVGAMQAASGDEPNDIFFIRLAEAVVKTSRAVKVVPVADESDFSDLPPEKQKSLSVVKSVLQKLSFEARALLLLRDQLHFSYADMAVILKASENNVRSETTQAHVQFREKIEEVLSGAG